MGIRIRQGAPPLTCGRSSDSRPALPRRPYLRRRLPPPYHDKPPGGIRRGRKAASTGVTAPRRGGVSSGYRVISTVPENRRRVGRIVVANLEIGLPGRVRFRRSAGRAGAAAALGLAGGARASPGDPPAAARIVQAARRSSGPGRDPPDDRGRDTAQTIETLAPHRLAAIVPARFAAIPKSRLDPHHHSCGCSSGSMRPNRRRWPGSRSARSMDGRASCRDG